MLLFLDIAFWKRVFGKRCQRCDIVPQACDTTSFLFPLLVRSLQPSTCMKMCRVLHKFFRLPEEILTHTFFSGQQAECWARGLSIANNLHAKGMWEIFVSQELCSGSAHPKKWQYCPTTHPCSEDRAFSFGQRLVTRSLYLPSHCLLHLAPFPAWARLLCTLLSFMPFSWLWLCVCFLSHMVSVSFTAQNNKELVERVLLSSLSSFILSLTFVFSVLWIQNY